MNSVFAIAPPIIAAAMLSRNDDSTNTMASSAKQPFQSMGSRRGRASGTWLFSKWRERMANPSSRHARFAMITHSCDRCVTSPLRPGPAGNSLNSN